MYLGVVETPTFYHTGQQWVGLADSSSTRGPDLTWKIMRQRPVASDEIAGFLGFKAHGPKVFVTGVCSLNNPRPHCLCYSNAPLEPDQLRSMRETFAIIPLTEEGKWNIPHVCVARPRLAFALACREFFTTPADPTVHASAIVSPTARIEPGVAVGPFAVIEDAVIIRTGTAIEPHAVIKSGVHIGRDCRIGSSTVIGHPGFGVERDDQGRGVRLPHFGSVRIGDRVEIGAFCTVCAGTIEPTSIGDDVFIDDHVHVAHNVIIGSSCTITACAEISGSTVLGAGVWLGPNCSLMNKISIGAGSVIGLGAVVTRSVPPESVVMGNPARPRASREDGNVER